MSQEENQLIPKQEEGTFSDTETTATFDSFEAAKQFYEIAKQRVLHVNDWQEWAGAATANFQLTDAHGTEVKRTVQQSDYFKIDIPGPGTVTGDGFDWVQVEKVEEATSAEQDHIIIQVRPASNPKNKRTDVAHFFSDAATSSFVVKREGNLVSAAVHGRNEKPNTTAETLIDKARNTAMATGAVAAFSKLQWKALVNGLVKQD